MELSCLLCLEKANDEQCNCIKADSVCWEELNIREVIEKHFWPLDDILQSSSWLCLKCWQELKNFHAFYVGIENAHRNHGKLKTIKEDLTSFGFLEPEILINEPITSKHNVEVKSELSITEQNNDYMQNFFEDPLEKLECKIEEKKHLADAKIGENVHIKLEPDEATEYKNSNSSFNSGMDSIKQDSKCSEESIPIKKHRIYTKTGKNYRDNDVFIMKHFQEMICDLCEVRFKDFTDMQEHFMKTHKQVGYLMCCSRKFYHRNRLVDHIHTHLNPEHFKCDQCGKVLSDRVKLKRHMLCLHRPNHVGLQHYCDICGKSFINSSVLRNHKLTHLPEEEKKFPCSDCGKRYASQYLLKVHREVIHLNKIAKICYVCGVTLRTNTEYKSHMNKHEGVTTNLNCDVCGLRLTSERGLKVHKESQHPVGGKQEHKCTQCPKVSPTLRALKKHFNTMHVKGYEHKCTICEKSFKRTEALKEHIASHSGTALYTCPWCPKTFNSNSNMHSHRKKMHPKEWEEAKLQKYVIK